MGICVTILLGLGELGCLVWLCEFAWFHCFIDYPGVVYTPSADLTTIKLLLDSIISTKNSRFVNINLKYFYLNTPMSRYEYMWVPVKLIPQDIFNEYKLKRLV